MSDHPAPTSGETIVKPSPPTIEDLMAQACLDPGQFVERNEAEPSHRWQARAVYAALFAEES